MKKGTFAEDYKNCLRKTEGQHNFGITCEELLKVKGRTSFPCKNCGFLIIWDSNLLLKKE